MGGTFKGRDPKRVSKQGLEGAAIIRGVVSGGETKGRKKTGRARSLEVSVAGTGFRSPEQKVGGAGEGSGDLRCCPGLRVA